MASRTKVLSYINNRIVRKARLSIEAFGKNIRITTEPNFLGAKIENKDISVNKKGSLVINTTVLKYKNSLSDLKTFLSVLNTTKKVIEPKKKEVKKTDKKKEAVED